MPPQPSTHKRHQYYPKTLSHCRRSTKKPASGSYSLWTQSITELEKLLATHTKAGHLDSAIAIRAELARLSPPASEGAKPTTTNEDRKNVGNSKQRKLLKELAGSRWVSEQWGATLTLNADGTTIFEGKKPRKIEWSVSENAKLMLADEGKKMADTDWRADGKSFRFYSGGWVEWKLEQK